MKYFIPQRSTPVVLLFIAPLLAFAVLVGCESDASENGSAHQAEERSDELTDFEQEHGIGPITQPVSLQDEIDQQLAARGEDLFQTKCESCHRMDSRLVGPPLGDVTERRSPAFIMNFIMNPSGMVREHPEGQRLMQEYLMEMPFQNVNEEEARAILEYLRTET